MFGDNTQNQNIFIYHGQAEASPAPGAASVIVMPENCRTEVIQLQFTLATDANPANRAIHITGVIQGYLWNWGYEATSVIQNLTIDYTFWPHRGIPVNTSSLASLIGSFNGDLIFESLNSLTIHIINVQAGDQLSNISLCYRLWPL